MTMQLKFTIKEVNMKAIVSVLGKDKKGIIAKVSNALFKSDCNILDISQTIMQSNYFTMLMMVETGEKSISEVNEVLNKIADEMAVEIRIQHENIFTSMNSI